MPYDQVRDAFAVHSGSRSGPARNWYTLAAADIGAKELPAYARAFEVILSFDVALPFTVQVVPIGAADGDVRSITYYEPGRHAENRGIRRVVSVAGGTTVPAGVQIDLITA